LAVPVASPGLELHRLVVEHFMELGDAGGVTVWWRPIASPTLADPIYKQLRTPEMARQDQREARKYRRLCLDAGGEENYVRSQYFALSEDLKIHQRERPAIALIPHPDCGARAVLKISPAAFETDKRRRELAFFLQQEFSESRVAQASFDASYDSDSMVKLQEHFHQMEGTIESSIAKGLDISKRTWRSSLVRRGFIDSPDPELHTTATAWRKKGSIFLRTKTDGVLDGEVEFALQDGRISKQMDLIWKLLLAWKSGIAFRDIARQLYKDEFREACRTDDRALMTLVAKRVRGLVHDIRTKKLLPAGINPDILPTVLKPKSPASLVRLRLCSLDRSQLGHLTRRPI